MLNLGYQSHQSGIETVICICTLGGEWATNRTNLELKHISCVGIGYRNVSYQSHQSGIETWVFIDYSDFSSATNRTNLELKRSQRF